jgi:alpha-mannosidase
MKQVFVERLAVLAGLLVSITAAAQGIAGTVAGSADTGATGTIVWQIGTFNESPSEFNNGNSGAPFFGALYPMGLVYDVGKSKPGTDWAGHQLGSSISESGGQSRPYAIQFDLDQVSQGSYTLRIALLNEEANLGQLQIEINGHTGLFYLKPKLTYTGGTRAMVTSAIAATETLVVNIPVKFLRKGTNKIVLTAVDEPSEAGSDAHSSLTYDALELDHDRVGKVDTEQINVEADPTAFYVRRGGVLLELVDIFVRRNGPVHQGEISLDVGGKKFSEQMHESDFGEQRAEFSIPEFATTTKGVATVSADGRSQRFPLTLAPARKWTLLVVPHVHVDVGYSDYQEKVAEIQSRELDEAINLIHEHPMFRFSPDGYWSVRQYLAGRTEDQQKQLFEMVKNKKIFVPAEEASLLTGFPSLETLIRSLYPAFEFNQQHGGDFDYANITDVPSYSWSYASVLAAAGLKYFVAGCDDDNAPILLYSRLNEKSPFWWEGPDGGRILMWYSRAYAQLNYLFGGSEGRIASGRESLPRFLQAYSQPTYKADSVLVYGSQVENTDLFPRQSTVAEDWNKVYAYPHLKYSGFSEAMSSIARQFGDSIPVVRGDGGPYWEFGIASTARSAALARGVEQRAPAAEEFSTVSGLVNPSLKANDETLKQLWNNLTLYAEHTWGNHGSISDPKSQETVDQLAVKEAFASDAERDNDYVLRRALAGIADSISEPKNTLLIFNPLSWPRSKLVEMDLDKGRELVDLVTQRTVPYEVLETGKNYRRVRFLANDIPAVGYKAFDLKTTGDEPPAPQATPTGTLENKFYRVAIDPATGSVMSIFDKSLNKELVNASSPYRFDQYLYVTGGDDSPNRILEYSSGWPIPQLTVNNSGAGKIVSVTREPFGMVARLESSGLNTPKIETEIILFDDQKKIEFINHVHKTEVYSKEGVYFAFPFAMDQPQFRYEIQSGVVNPAHDQMPGAGEEEFSVQHWVAANQDGITAALVPLDASLVTLGDIQRGTYPDGFGKRTGTIFSEIMNNYYFTNYAAGQGGEFTFRYVLTSGKDLQPGDLSRFGREEMSPLEIDQITRQDKSIDSPRRSSAQQESFLNVDQPGVALVTWKNAENGNGTILRFLEIAGKESDVNVQLPLLNVKAAWASDALERSQKQLATSPHGFQFPVKPFQIVTVRVQGTSVPGH